MNSLILFVGLLAVMGQPGADIGQPAAVIEQPDVNDICVGDCLMPRSFAVMSTAVWESVTVYQRGEPNYADLTGDTRGLSQPRLSPDAKLVLIDKPGNVDFSDREQECLKRRGAEFIQADKIQAWLKENKWEGKDQI